MADINLDEKNNKYENANSSVEVSNEICQGLDSFEKVTYKITYKQEYPSPSSWYWFWQWKPFYLYIRFRTTRTPFTYYPKEKKHVIDEVEVYYSRKHPGIPLILGFKREEPAKFTYYTFLFLKHQSSHTGFPSKNYFYSDQLEEKLKQENDKRNKIKFVTRKVGSVDYDEKEDDSSFNDYMKWTYTPKDDEKTGDYEFPADSLFKKEAKIYIDNAFFNELNDHKFEFISVYYIKKSKIALLVEFMNGSGKKFFVRRDINGTYWSEKTINYEESSQLETHLQCLEDEFENYIAYQLDKTSNDQFYKPDYISVFSYNHSGFKVVTHTPSGNFQSKSPFVLFGKSLLELDKTQKITGSRLDDIHKKTYHNINVNYYNSRVQGKNVDINVPFFLELREKSNEKRYYLLRSDKKGVKWKEVDNASVSLSDPSKKQPMIRHIDYYSNRSIMVIINYNGIIINRYILHSVENSFNEDDQIIKHSSENIIIDQGDTLSGSTYKYCEHRFSHSRTLNGEDDCLFSMAGLRLYISDASNGSIDHGNSIEIKTYNSKGSAREILYNESNGKKINLYVYFRGQINIPLLVQHDDTFYKPYSREQYFEKWVQVDGLKGSRPDDSHTVEKIKNELDEISTNLNDIDISKTNVKGYGIKNKKESEQGKEYYELVNKTFSGKRIDVKQENNKYTKLIHSTVDKVRMDKIKYGDTLLQNESNQNLSTVLKSVQYNTVVVHYHISDSGYLTPLLIKTGSTTSTSSLFYERITKESNINWKRVGDTSKLQSDGLGLENKINTIHYNLNNSLKIQLEHHEKASYLIKLVKNVDSSDIIADGEYGKVNVLNDNVSSLESKYSSYKHTINYSKSNEPKDVGGIRLYIHDNEISIYSNNANDKCPIYYDPSIKEVFVYFCGSDKVPLLVCYNNKYYTPNSRDQYFQKWVLKPDITDKSQLQSKLDAINKILNQIDISETENNTKYGIPQPSKENRGLNKEFYNRVSVTSCKSNHFRKVTHTTTYGFIGAVMYGLKSTNISPADSDHETDKLCLYYDSKDNHFTKPLLIKLCSTTNKDICHWYSRTSTDISSWKNESEKAKYDSHYNLEKQLKLIGELFVRLLVQIDKQGTEYDIIATKGSDSTSNSHLEKINLNIMTSLDSISVNGYRFYYHSLSNYYQENRVSIISKLGLLDKSDLELEIVVQIFDRIIALVDLNEKPLYPPLTFTKTDNEQNRVLFVYFYESGESIYQTDKIPLLIYYRTSFYAPFSKDSYFEKWKKVFELSDLQSNRLLGSQGLTNDVQGNHDPEGMKKAILKKELDKINQMLNEIHTSKQEDYGLPFCGQPFYNKRGGPNSKRIIVKKHKNNNYVMYVHTTSNGYEIGSINTGSSKLDDHKKENGNKNIDELAAIFENKDLSNPELLLVNEKRQYGDGSITHGYYYKSDNTRPFKYKFTKLNYGCDLMNKLKEGNSNYKNNCNNDFADVKVILDKIVASRMVIASGKHEVYYMNCKGDYDSELRLKKCPEMVVSKPRVTSGLDPQVLREDRRRTSSGDPDSSRTQQQQKPPDQETPTPVTSSVPEPEPPPSDLTHTLESSETGPAVPERGNLKREGQSPGLEKGGGSPPEVSVDSNSVTPLDSWENTGESRGSGTTVHNVQEHERTLGSIEQVEGIPAQQSSRSVVPTAMEVSVSDHVSNKTEGTGGHPETAPKGVADKIMEIIEENPEAVYGGGGSLVTVAGGAYPAYKVIANIITK